MNNKLFIIQVLAACVFSPVIKAQRSVSIDWYGFVAAQSWMDTHESVSSAEGFLYLYPKDELPAQTDGHDEREFSQASWFGTMARLGFTLKGPDVLGASTRAKAEIEFSGHSSPGSVLYRHAFLALDWKNSSLVLGQTWHPMNDLFPNTVSIAIGSPFNALNRSPQLRYEYYLESDRKTRLTGAAVFQGANASNGPAGKSYNYIRRSMIPMLYAGLDYDFGDLKIGVGLEYHRISPVISHADNNRKYYMDGLCGMLQVQYAKDRLSFKAKTLLGEDMSHLGICSGFGLAAAGGPEYVPLKASSTWAQVQYGKELKIGVFGGYMCNLGADKDVSAVYAAENGSIGEMWRVAPNIQYSVGNMVLGCEYELTSVAYGNLKADGRVTDTHNVNNNRLLLSVMYSF